MGRLSARSPAIEILDLNTVETVVAPAARHVLPTHAPGDAFLAGGTWLFSEPQTGLKRLIDLAGLGWPALEMTEAGLQIGATCTIATLAAFEPPADWLAGLLILQCCQALLGSFKIWNMATVGGNLCLALPAGPMISLCVALNGACVIWRPDGSERVLPVHDFIVDAFENALAPGEILRSIQLPVAALRRRTAFRQISLSSLGRSAALLIGTLAADGFTLTITAATRRPVCIRFDIVPEKLELRDRVDTEISQAAYYDDVHGRPAWRRHMTLILAEEIRREFAA